MAGKYSTVTLCFCSLSLLALLIESADAQPRASSEPIGGITFQPPRQATIRHKGGNLLRGSLIGISPEWVHLRASNGREFQYPLSDIRSIVTADREFRYVAAYNTYREAVEQAQGLQGVTIADAVMATSSNPPVSLPSPPAPPMPVVVEEAEYYALAESKPKFVGDIPRTMPQIPPSPVNHAPTGSGGGVAPPFHETGAFKIGFLVACFGTILIWWRNRVG